MKKLNTKQREFLEYLLTNHYGLGWSGTISDILRSGEYNPDGGIDTILARFELLKKTDSPLHIPFKKPTKYLK